MAASEPPPVDMDALVAQAMDGDRRAAEELIMLYQQRMARFVIGQTNDEAHYEDLCQTIFVKMVLALPKLRAPGRFEPWLFQIARNVCRDHLRARQGWRRLFVSYDAEHEAVAVVPMRRPTCRRRCNAASTGCRRRSVPSCVFRWTEGKVMKTWRGSCVPACRP